MRLQGPLALSILLASWLTAQGQVQSPALELGKNHSYEMAGRSQEHYFLLQVGDYVRLRIAQQTVNVAVAVIDPAGKELFVLDNNAIGDEENVELIAADAGRHRLRVTTSEPNAPSGSYQVMLAAVNPGTNRDRDRIVAAREVALATAANRQGTREAMLQAIRHFEAARSHWHTAEDPGEEARTLYTIAFIYIELGDEEKALSNATAALPLAQTAGNKQLLGRFLDCIGEVHNNFSDKKEALDYYMQALTSEQASGDRAGEAQTLNNLGVAYLGLADKRKALDLLNESKGILRQLHETFLRGDDYPARAAGGRVEIRANCDVENKRLGSAVLLGRLHDAG